MNLSQISQIMTIAVLLCSHQLKTMERSSGGPVRACDKLRSDNPYGNPNPTMQGRGFQRPDLKAMELRNLIQDFVKASKN